MEYPVQHAPRQATEHAAGHEAAGHDAGGQQHPIGLYLKVWGYLFLLSAMSYLVDYFQVQGVLRWSLIIIFMLLKAGLIVSIFMHLAWERLSLIYAILVPPLCLAALVGIMLVESRYT